MTDEGAETGSPDWLTPSEDSRLMAGLLERGRWLSPLGGWLVDKALDSEVQHSMGNTDASRLLSIA